MQSLKLTEVAKIRYHFIFEVPKEEWSVDQDLHAAARPSLFYSYSQDLIWLQNNSKFLYH